MLRALADPTRLRVVELLAGWVGPRSGPVRAGELGLCARDLEMVIGLPHALLSHHLRTLRNVGLVEVERRGRWAVHRLCQDQFAQVGGALLQLSAPQRPRIVPAESARGSTLTASLSG